MVEMGGGRGDSGDKAREEFFSEAQEIVDGLSRDLLALDEQLKEGVPDHELVNDVFRAVHTLKGLSGLFGVAMMSGLSHELEDLLDDLRLGRVELGAHVLDLLFRAVELYVRILASAKGEGPEPVAEVKQLLVAFGQVAHQRGGAAASALAQYELDPGLLTVLTEYEEHRLRSNVQAGMGLYRIRVQFALASIDSALDALKAKAKPHGEIITYLPTGTGGDADTIELEILLASRAAISTLGASLAAPNVTIDEVPRRGQTYSEFPSLPAPGEASAVAFVDEMATGPRTSLGPGTVSSYELTHGLGFEPGSESSGHPDAEGRGPTAREGNRSAKARHNDGDLSSERSSSEVGEPGTPRRVGDPPTDDSARLVARRRGEAKPDKGDPAGGRDISLRSVTQTVRVDIRKLDRLMNIVGELAIVRSAVLRLAERVKKRPELREFGTDLLRIHRTFERHLLQMQNGILEVRMVPLGQVFDKLARIVRQTSRDYDKPVHLVVTGAETEIDKLIVEELSDPLMHMMRNAIDHGIESRDERLRVAKPPTGTIALNAFQKGNHVLIEVEDDGRGMDPAALVAAAVKRGLVSAEEARELTHKEALGLVFMPGFTTRDDVTDLSGRGFGMDVVKTNIAKLGGIVDITSEFGIGTKMTITLPVTLAIVSVLLVGVSGRTYCIPLANIEEAIVLDEATVRTVEGREVMTQRGGTLPICRLARLFGHASLATPFRSYVVVATVGQRRLGFVVDHLIGQQDVVLKALGPSLSGVRGFAGATELEDQRVGLVLDPGGLIEEVLAGADGRFAGGAAVLGGRS